MQRFDKTERNKRKNKKISVDDDDGDDVNRQHNNVIENEIRT